MIKPRALQEGDKVAAVTLSWGGPGTFPDRYLAGKRQLEETFNIEVIETPNALRSAEWIHANPQARAADLMEAFADRSIAAIISTIGGDESVRILPFIDLAVIKNNPKILLGYSDTTVTHLACFRAGLISFYGPSVMAGFAENTGIFAYMADSVRRTLFSDEPVGAVEPNREGWTVEHLNWSEPKNQLIKRKLRPPTGPKVLQGTGRARGHLIGGCVDVLEMLKGTDYWPSFDRWKGAIMFLETSEEAPNTAYFTRWMRNYGSQGILNLINGIILARPGGQLPDAELFGYDEALKSVAREFGISGLPIMSQMDFGHTDPMFVLPYGVAAEIDCDTSTFTILDAGVERNISGSRR